MNLLAHNNCTIVMITNARPRPISTNCNWAGWSPRHEQLGVAATNYSFIACIFITLKIWAGRLINMEEETTERRITRQLKIVSTTLWSVWRSRCPDELLHIIFCECSLISRYFSINWPVYRWRRSPKCVILRNIPAKLAEPPTYAIIVLLYTTFII